MILYFIVSLLKSDKNNYLFLLLKQLYLIFDLLNLSKTLIMRNITKYLKKIDDSLDTLIKNKDVVQKAHENLATINRLEEEIKKNKNIKIESMELIEQSIREVEKLIIDSKKKSNKSG